MKIIEEFVWKASHPDCWQSFILYQLSTACEWRKCGRSCFGRSFRTWAQDLNLSWHKSGVRLRQWCICVASPLVEGCVRDIHFVYPISASDQLKPSSRLRRFFTRVHHDQWCSSRLPLSTFFSFVIETIMEVALSSYKNSANNICSDDFAVFSEEPSNLQVFFYRLHNSVCMFGIHFAHSKSKVFLPACIGSKLNPVIVKEIWMK